MLKKLLKFILISAVICSFLLVLVLKNPNIIGFFVEKFTHNTLAIENIDFDFDIEEKIVTFDIQNMVFANQKMHIQGNNIQYQFNLNTFHSIIKTKKLNINYQGLKTQTSLHAQTIKDAYSIAGKIKNIKVADVIPHLEVIPFPKVINYLQQALKTGEAKNVRYQIVVSDTDYSLDIDGKINDGYIKFANGWDYIDNVIADFTINREKMIIDFSSATIKDIVANGEVEINWAEKLFIQVNATTSSTTQKALQFLRNQPFSQELLEVFHNLDASGKVNAVLNLHIPISDNNRKPNISVNADLIDNNLNIFDNKATIKNITAKLKLNDTLSVIGSANTFDYQSDINVVYDKNLVIDATNSLGNFVINKDENNWGVNIVGKDIFADFLFDNSNSTPVIQVNNLVLNTKQFKGSTNQLDITPEDIKDFKLSVKNININNTKIPDFKTEFVKKREGMHIKDLHFKDIKLGEENITFNGLWVGGLISFKTNLAGEKLDDLFTSFDIKEKTIGGKFTIDLRGFCQCNPWQLTLDKLSGYGKVHIQEGVFSEQDANIGRILSILNISTLTKRLQLDVDDVVNKGFSYDTINSEVILNTGGIATIENFNLDSSSSKINISGNSDIVNKTYNLKAEIIPAVKDSIPVATALAGGGAAGLGVWLIDKYIFQEKILNSVLGGVVNYKYKISGTWDKPNIEKL